MDWGLNVDIHTIADMVILLHFQKQNIKKGSRQNIQFLYFIGLHISWSLIKLEQFKALQFNSNELYWHKKTYAYIGNNNKKTVVKYIVGGGMTFCTQYCVTFCTYLHVIFIFTVMNSSNNIQFHGDKNSMKIILSTQSQITLFFQIIW